MDIYEARGLDEELPASLADLHRTLSVGTPVEVRVPIDRQDDRTSTSRIMDLLIGAGFEVEKITIEGDELRASSLRARTLPDTVGPRMRLLVCGLNPSLYSADAGVGFARRGNRFWPAALGVGVVSRDRDPIGALEHDRVGMTDLVKRATARASELETSEYVDGVSRVRRLVEWLQPNAVCFVGLAGWRAAVNRSASPGLQPGLFGKCPAYVMPSTSGLNGRSTLLSLREHLKAAMEVGLMPR